jgi:hypothetical protein
MGVILGTLTTKTGLVIPLPTAADDLVLPEAEVERRKEEHKYSRCIHPASSGKVWEGGREIGRAVTRPVALYIIKTETLKRRGNIMEKTIDYDTNQFRMFEYLFKHPDEWLDSSTIGKVTGVPTGSASAALKPIKDFLKSESLVLERKKDGTAAGMEFMFKGKCDNAGEESRIWYAKMLEDRRKGKKKSPAAKGSNPQPQAPAPRTSSTVTPVQVDTGTMEAIVRVPLSQLAAVLNLLRA